MNKKSVLLPSHVCPERYEISVRPDTEHFTFTGQETVHMRIKKPVRQIHMHAKDLAVAECRLKTGGQELDAKKILFNKKSETVTFVFDKAIPTGDASLHLTFSGVLNNLMRGFYRSSYVHKGKEKYLATTQFEATDARRAFPCIDEPAAKAIFDVTLIVPAGATAISNTIETEILEHEPGYKVVKFQPTPKMSTYLLAFIVGDFEFIEGKTKDGVLVRVFTVPGKKQQAKFALRTAIRCVEFYNKYFDIPYPLPVMDLIAIPDFTAAAMENWGAITYRESALLVDDEHTSAANKQWVAIVIAHEIAHQWFGNLVTMRWWTDLWLNEGFASYMEHFCVDSLFPEWDIWKQYVSGRYATALKLDSLSHSHPIEVEVHHPDEINEIFDMVSYAKGSAVIRMLARYLGEKDFREGLRVYLKSHSYGNAVTHDLWKAFEKVSHKPVTAIMKTWTKTTGYPLVNVEENGGKLRVSQERFFSSPQSAKKTGKKQRWPIPVEFINESGEEQQKLLTQKEGAVEYFGGWLKGNAGEYGFYRVGYSRDLLEKLAPAISNKQLSAPDRLGVIRDLFALCEAGQCSCADLLVFLQHYRNEDELAVWEEICAGLAAIKQLIAGEKKLLIQFNRFSENLLGAVFKKVGWEKLAKETHAQSLLRSLVLYQAGSSGNSGVIARAKKIFFESTKNKLPIPADIRGVVYSITAQNGGVSEWNELAARYKSTDIHEERERLGRALGEFKQSSLLRKTLAFSLSKEVRAQDSPSLAAAVARNPAGRQLEWKFVQDNWSRLTGQFGQGGHLLEWYISSIGKFSTLQKAEEIELFFKTHPTGGIARTVKQHVERVRSNTRWLAQVKKQLPLFFKKYPAPNNHAAQ